MRIIYLSIASLPCFCTLFLTLLMQPSPSKLCKAIVVVVELVPGLPLPLTCRKHSILYYTMCMYIVSCILVILPMFIMVPISHHVYLFWKVMHSWPSINIMWCDLAWSILQKNISFLFYLQWNGREGAQARSSSCIIHHLYLWQLLL